MSLNAERYQIGEVAKASEISIDTIRYYEKLGLLEKPIRSVGGFRLYTERTIERLKFIRKAQSFGLTLSEIGKIIRESERGLERCCSYVSELFQKKLGELEVKMKELQKTRLGLKGLMKQWIPLTEARTKSFAVCPQIEVERGRKKGGKENVKKKN